MNLGTPVTILALLLAIIAGVIVAAGYFLDLPLLANLSSILLRWGVILAAVLLLVGVVNLSRVHLQKLTTRQPRSGYSLILLLALLATLVVGGFFGPTAPATLWIFNYIQVPIEASLMAILAVILAVAAARLLGRRLTILSLVFLGTALLVLIGTASVPFLDLPILGELRAWILQVPATAGARGILLGVALGTLATGLRVLMGADRPYGG